ncbi:hypothetical protein [Mesorhizobium sp. INR15]|uniref:hypothetical protein n=1 Tax=Mesorhizobium sp. INR15 TaxID=2654248 RepID=UPI0018965AFD|nr:hypothetical protein [Mesorhizobium sp. INR15]
MRKDITPLLTVQYIAHKILLLSTGKPFNSEFDRASSPARVVDCVRLAASM